MLFEYLGVVISLLIFLVVNVEVSIIGVPFWVTHLIFLDEVFLWTPHILAAVWVLLSAKGSL